MAGKRIQGITIEIGGNTTKLAASLKNVDNSISATKRALSDVDKLLKLDPSNTELLSQKQKLLGEAVEQTKERLAKLKEASEAAAKTKDNYDAWKAAITPLWQEIDKTSAHLKDLNARQKEMEDAGQVDTDAYKALQQEIDKTSGRLKDLKAQAKQVTEEFGHPIAPEKYDALQREIVETEHDLKDLEEKSKGTAEAEKKLALLSQEVGKGLHVLGDAAKAVGATLAAAFAASSAAVMAFSKSAVDVGSTFDKSMSQVAATMDKSVAEIQNLRDFAQDMGAKTAFSATQAADALNFMALAGYDAQTSMTMLPNVLNLAAAGSMELAAASDMITDSQSALGLSLDETSKLVDQMAAASSKANASVSQMGSAILTVGGTAKVLKGGTTELNTALGLLADNGVKGAEGGTALRNVILSLTAPTDKAAATLKELGVKALDSSGNMRSMKDIFTDLDKALSGMSDGKKTEVLSEIFNKTDLKSVNALLSTNVERWDELSAAIEHSKYAAELMADTQLDNLAGDVTLFKSALEGAQIVVSDGLMPQLRDFVQFGTEGITRVTDAFRQSNEAISLAEGFRDAEGAMRPLEDIATELTARFGETAAVASTISFRDAEGSLKDVGAFADELSGKLSAMSHDEQFSVARFFGLDGEHAVDDLWEILDPVNQLDWKLQKMMEAASAAASGDMNVLQAMFPDADAAEILSWFDGSEEGLAKLKAAIETVDASNINDGFSAAMAELPALVDEAIAKVTEYLPEAMDIGAQILGAVLDGIADNLPELATGAAQIVDSLGHELGERIPALSGVFDNLSAVVASATAAFVAFKTATAISAALATLRKATEAQTIAQAALNAVTKAASLAGGPFVIIATVIAGVTAALITLWHTNEDFRNAVTAIWESIKNFFFGTVEKIKSVIDGFKRALGFAELGEEIDRELAEGVSENAGTVEDAGEKLAESFSGAVESQAEEAGEAGKALSENFAEGISENADKAEAEAESLTESAADAAASHADAFAWVGEMFGERFAEGIADSADKAESEAEKFAQKVYSAINTEIERQTRYQELSLAEQLNLWREAQRHFDEGSDQWWNARDKVYGLEIKIAEEQAKAIKDTYNGLVKDVEYAAKRYGLSSAEQLAEYEKIRDRFEKNSEEWLAADEKVFDTREKLLKEQAQAVRDTYNGLVKDVEYAAKRYGLSTAEQLAEYEKIRDRFVKNSEEWLAADEKVFDTREKLLKEQAQAVRDTYNGLVKDVEYAAKRYGLSTAEQLAEYEKIRDRFVKNSEEWLAADEKVFDTREKLLKEQAQAVRDTYNGLVKDVEYAAKRYGLSTAEQLAEYEKIRDRFVQNSEEWLAADEKVFDTREKLLKEQAQAVKDTYNGLVKDVGYAAKRYGLSTAEQLAEYEKIRDRFVKDSEEWLAADEKVFDTREKLLKEQESAWKDYTSNLKGVLDTVSGLESDYQRELSKRAGEIANSYKLFAEVPAAKKIESADLLKNLREQVKSIRAFYDNLEKLSERGAGDALVSEIRSMGVGASDELEALLRMSDRQLARYANLYGEKQELANNIAVKELSGLREETDSKIRENLENIESLYDEYAPVIGMSLPEGLAEGIRNGMREALNAADELAAALQARFDNMGGGTGLQSLMDAASENARVLAVEPASQRRQNSAVQEKSYGYETGELYAPSAPVNFNVYNNVGGTKYERLQYRYREAENVRRGPSLVKR